MRPPSRRMSAKVVLHKQRDRLFGGEFAKGSTFQSSLKNFLVVSKTP